MEIALAPESKPEVDPTARNIKQTDELCLEIDQYLLTFRDQLDSNDSDVLAIFVKDEVVEMKRWIASGMRNETESTQEEPRVRTEHLRLHNVADQEDQDIFLHNNIVLARGPQALELFRLLRERGVQRPVTMLGLGLRQVRSAFGGAQFTWADHKELKPTLREYLEAGVAITDLRGSKAAFTYFHLRDRFGFQPDDLTINRNLFSVGHLRMLYKVTWQELLVDFCVGPEDFLLRLQLPIEDLCTLGFSITLLTEWPWKEAFKTRGRAVPGRDAENPRTAAMRRRLDREMFLKCRHYNPRDWIRLMGMTYEDLLDRIGLKRSDPWRMWGDMYFESVEKLAKAFGYIAEDGQCPFTMGRRKKHKTKQKDKPKKSERKVGRSLSSSGSSSSSSSSGILDFLSGALSGSNSDTEEDNNSKPKSKSKHRKNPKPKKRKHYKRSDKSHRHRKHKVAHADSIRNLPAL